MDGTVLVADDDRTIRTVLISDVMMPDGNGIEALPEILELRPGLPVIVISAQNTITTAIAANEADAYDYLPKPFDLPDLMKRANRALERKRVVARAADTPAQATQTGEELPLIGRTPAMQALYKLVAQVVKAGGDDHRRKRHWQKPDCARHPRLFRPAHAAFCDRYPERSGRYGRACRDPEPGQGGLGAV